MNQRPVECERCYLNSFAKGFIRFEGLGSLHAYNKVLIVGEAGGEHEAEAGWPFRPIGQAGSLLNMAIRLSGYDRSQFRLTNVLQCHPPGNNFPGEKWEQQVAEYCLEHHTIRNIQQASPLVILALGDIALKYLADWDTERSKCKISDVRGFVFRSKHYPAYLVAGLHPSFIRRGNAHLTPTLVYDIKKAVAIAQGKFNQFSEHPEYEKPNYITHPSLSDRISFGYRVRDNPNLTLGYDIETDDSIDIDEDEREGLNAQITQIQFSLGKNEGCCFEWTTENLPLIRKILGGNSAKIGHNNIAFDNPRIKSKDVQINGRIDDTMLAWHHYHPDLPAGLQKVSSMYSFPFPWKHLSGSDKAFYGCCDVDALHYIWDKLPNQMKLMGVWDSYQDKVIEVAPILQKASARGIPIDRRGLEEFKTAVTQERDERVLECQKLAPNEICGIHPKEGYKKPPKDVLKYEQAFWRDLEQYSQECDNPECEYLGNDCQYCGGLKRVGLSGNKLSVEKYVNRKLQTDEWSLREFEIEDKQDDYKLGNSANGNNSCNNDDSDNSKPIENSSGFRSFGRIFNQEVLSANNTRLSQSDNLSCDILSSSEGMVNEPEPNSDIVCCGIGDSNHGNSIEQFSRRRGQIDELDSAGCNSTIGIRSTDVGSGMGISIRTLQRVKVKRWCKFKPFNPGSSQQMIRYIRFRAAQDKKRGIKESKHKVPLTFKDKKETTGKEELERLFVATGDQMYRAAVEVRELNKMLSTDVPQWTPGQDGLVHSTFTFAPATWQTSSRNPNAQNVAKHPRRSEENKPKDKTLAYRFRKSFWAGSGRCIIEADYSSFHAVTLGFEAGCLPYMQLARKDIHSFVASYLKDAAKYGASPIKYDQSPEELMEQLKWFKKDPMRKWLRDKIAKPAILGIGFGEGANGLVHRYRESFPDRKYAQYVIDLIHSLFADKIRKFQTSIALKAGKQKYLISRWGAIRWFYDATRWDPLSKNWKMAEGSKEAIAFLPANDAFGMMRQKYKELESDGSNERFAFTNTIHDSIVFRPRWEDREECIEHLATVLPMPCEVLTDPVTAPEGLRVGVEISMSEYEGNWAEMKEVKKVVIM